MSAQQSWGCKSHTAGSDYVMIYGNSLISAFRDYILIVNFILMSLIPFLVLTSLNYSLFLTIKRSGQSCPQQGQRAGARQRRDQGIAAMLILVVLVFGLCNIIRIIINVYEVWWWFLRQVSRITCRLLWCFMTWVMESGQSGAHSSAMSPTFSWSSTALSTLSSTAGKILPSGTWSSKETFTDFLFPLSLLKCLLEDKETT